MAKAVKNKKTGATVVVDTYQNNPVYGNGLILKIEYNNKVLQDKHVIMYYECKSKHAVQVFERFTAEMAQQYYNNPTNFDLVLRNWINNNLMYYQFN